MTIPDPVAEIVALLRADTAVAAVAGTRVFGGEITDAVKASMPKACVVVSPAGGPGRPGTVRFRRGRIDTTCYGATLNQAHALHLVAREALELMRRTGSLFSAEISSDASLGRDPVTQWPTCYASYIVLSATEA